MIKLQETSGVLNNFLKGLEGGVTMFDWSNELSVIITAALILIGIWQFEKQRILRRFGSKSRMRNSGLNERTETASRLLIHETLHPSRSRNKESYFSNAG